MSNYIRINDTTAEQIITIERKQRITLDQTQKRVEFLTAELAKAKKVVDDLKALGLKTKVELEELEK